MNMKFKVVVDVHIRSEILDPQGAATERALNSLDHSAENVRVGKQIVFQLEAAEQADAVAQAKSMCDALLVNRVMETAAVTVSPVA